MMQMKTQIPKYFRIMQDLLAEIRRGELVAGMQVPSENELIETYKISNTTARKVHHELERSGWVTRIKGKGTYVCGRRVDRSADRILGFTRNMIESGRVPSTRLISAKVRRQDRVLSVNGRRYILRGPLCEIRRLRLADGIPMMIETRYVSERLCPGIRTKDLEGSLYDIYEQDYNLQLVQIDQSLSAILIYPEKVGFPGVEGEIPGFRVEGVTSTAKELILEMEESIYRGDMYRFSVRASRGSPREE
jgi:GntR family transcriptional regulator